MCYLDFIINSSSKDLRSIIREAGTQYLIAMTEHCLGTTRTEIPELPNTAEMQEKKQQEARIEKSGTMQ